MKREQNTPRDDRHGSNQGAGRAGGEDFAERVREHLHRGADVARDLIARLRGLLGDGAQGGTQDGTRDGTRDDTVPAAAPRRGGDAWMPHEPHDTPAAAPRKAARGVGPAPKPRAPRDPAAPTRLRDEEGDENELPAEFATATMGHVLLAQGRPDEALRIFRAVLDRSPDDQEAVRGLAVLEAERLGAAEPEAEGTEGEGTGELVEGEPFGMLDRATPPPGYDVSEARSLPVDPTSIVVFWEMTEGDLGRAGAVTGWGAQRTLCVVSMWTSPRGTERSERYIDDVWQIGDWFVTGLPAGATHYAAVGLRRGGQFVPVVHAAPVVTPRGRPAAVAARVRATVALPGRQGAADGGSPRIVGLQGPRDALASAAQQLDLRPDQLTETDLPDGAGAAEVYDRARDQWDPAPAGASEGLVTR